AQVLDKLIDEKLQLQEAKSLGITVGDDQMTDAFAQIAKQNNFSPEDFRKRLVTEGVKIDTLKDQLKSEIAWSQVVRRKLRPQINVSESDIDNKMDELSRAKGKPQFHVAEIFLSVPRAAQEQDVRADAQKLVEQITKGAHFSD